MVDKETLLGMLLGYNPGVLKRFDLYTIHWKSTHPESGDVLQVSAQCKTYLSSTASEPNELRKKNEI